MAPKRTTLGSGLWRDAVWLTSLPPGRRERLGRRHCLPGSLDLARERHERWATKEDSGGHTTSRLEENADGPPQRGIVQVVEVDGHSRRGDLTEVVLIHVVPFAPEHVLVVQEQHARPGQAGAIPEHRAQIGRVTVSERRRLR